MESDESIKTHRDYVGISPITRTVTTFGILNICNKEMVFLRYLPKAFHSYILIVGGSIKERNRAKISKKLQMPDVIYSNFSS